MAQTKMRTRPNHDKFGLKTPIDKNHIFDLKFNKKRNRWAGYHSKLKNKYDAIPNSYKANKNGVYQEIITYNEEQKYCTFFPDAWNEQMILNKVQEASLFENRVYLTGNGFIGMTHEGIYMHFWYGKDSNNQWIIKSVYPYIEESLQEILKKIV